MINVGDKAPEVLGINEKGEEIRLSAYKGKKIVLYFYPKDSTSGCTAQACNLRDNYSELRKAGYEVIGVSVDNEKSHQKFIEKNNLHGDFETFMLFKWIFKTFVAVYLVTHTFDIVVAVFELGQNVVHQSAALIGSDTALDFEAVMGGLMGELDAMEIGELFLLLIETSLIGLTMNALSICVMLVLVGRMIEIYIYCSIGPIPFATMVNREWGSMGNNYLRGLVALGLQGFFILVCVAVYTVLIQGIASAQNLHLAIWSCAGYTVLLCYSLFKTGNISKSIFNAH